MYQTLLAVVWLWYTSLCIGWSVHDTNSKGKEKLMKTNKSIAALPMLAMSSQNLLFLFRMFSSQTVTIVRGVLYGVIVLFDQYFFYFLLLF